MTELVVKLKNGAWQLTRDLAYQSELFDKRIIAPEGFVTDFASVPRIPFIYAIYGNRGHRESVIHDYLYQTHKSSRKTADRIFLEAMKVRKKSFFIRKAMYWGVRLGGRKAYNAGKERFRILNENDNKQ